MLEAIAFEKVDVSGMREFLNNCLNNLSYQNINNVRSSIEGDTIWKAGAKDNIKKALDTIVDDRIKDLEKTLNKNIDIINKIEIIKKNNESYKKIAHSKDEYDSMGKFALMKGDKAKYFEVQNIISNYNSKLTSIRKETISLINEVVNSN